jgi:type VI protein secretion system component Hcp
LYATGGTAETVRASCTWVAIAFFIRLAFPRDQANDGSQIIMPIYLKLEGFDGGGTAVDHQGEMEIASLELGPGPVVTGGRDNTAKPVSDSRFPMTLSSNQALPALLRASFEGKAFEATIRQTNAKGNDIQYDISDCRIASVSASGGMTHLVLSGRIRKVEYPPATREPGDAPITIGWDIAGNVKTG